MASLDLWYLLHHPSFRGLAQPQPGHYVAAIRSYAGGVTELGGPLAVVAANAADMLREAELADLGPATPRPVLAGPQPRRISVSELLADSDSHTVIERLPLKARR